MTHVDRVTIRFRSKGAFTLGIDANLLESS